ncbi:hypothetical protein ATCV1_z512L [Acanthocystis turfacea chlorella virus 1]|uniref:Uncharacterized protein z512L n=1 Tax=Chlorovirus heliozoae TaxID=322019 RepID=A7K9C2_9PHYC|nr:hypothetical protein ATCV1_z512L [Acanthocystis turfacea chlorella virus 1]ABT16646.1 hypothetical protein ATCV1_z512L [Acanthocystis turfacea chlorella virus 1]
MPRRRMTSIWKCRNKTKICLNNHLQCQSHRPHPDQLLRPDQLLCPDRLLRPDQLLRPNHRVLNSK